MFVDLLLADADGRLVLPRPLPQDVLARIPAAGVTPGGTEYLWSDGGDPNSLREQHWGLVVPTGPLGQRLLERVRPLRQAREGEQGGASARVYEVAPGLDGPASQAWKVDVFRKSAPRAKLPRYLLILGDFEQISLELQQALATDAFVGRLAFAVEEDYAAYAEKVLRWEQKLSRERAGRALFFAACDGTTATALGREVLIEPLLGQCREELELGELGGWELARIEGGGTALRERARTAGPDVLFTLSHGTSVPRDVAGASRRRALQGALHLGQHELLTAAEVAGQPFLPGGVWLCFACFGAGTPSRSAYYPWLESLWEEGASAHPPEHALASLPGEGEPPFVAALPQAALANPEGPLAFIGHVDLAWTYSFQDSSGRGRAERFTPAIAELLRGHRAGVAYHSLMSAAGEALTDLAICQQEHASWATRGGKLRPDAVKLGSLWMTWQDLRAFVLLGDPAVRLPMTRRGPALSRP